MIAGCSVARGAGGFVAVAGGTEDSVAQGVGCPVAGGTELLWLMALGILWL